MYNNLAVLTAFAFLFSVIAGRIERSVLTGPMVYIFFGLLAGPLGLGILDLEVDAIEVRVIADLTLALVLFLDAANADLKVLRTHAAIPRRMLLIGLPICIALGAYLGTLVFPSMSLWEVCLLATILAATDAALGKGVVSNPNVPDRVRQGLNAESGLNDGLAVPFLFVFLALATGAAHEDQGTELALYLVAKEIGIGMLVAVVLVTAAVQLMKLARDRGWFTEVWRQLTVVTLALTCFATAQSLHGSGFIACFVGGLLFGYFAGDKTHHLVLAGEGIGELLGMLTWVVFGSVIMGQYWDQLSWSVLLYSLLSLTVIRMLPILIALTGSGLDLETKLFLAWFGPRGLASIVFLVIVGAENLPSESILIQTVVCTITLCVIAHGVTANPWAARLARKESG
ncbi:MAG: cation:proton antiporter [Halieaceae bacterium]|nr:cation:proton antiporter [Halieaceae bacterium]